MIQIKEQVYYDAVSGLTFEFVRVPEDVECPFRLKVYGDLIPFGNRQFEINANGEVVGSGTAVS